ncbi:MAG: hypothetical protein FWH38_02440 [Treponema sp.]|nr:hypothetical protein [Treponema sp.]
MFNRAIYLSCSFIALMLPGCVSITEKAGEALDGSAFAEKNIAVYRTGKNELPGMEIREVRNKANESSVIITLDKFPSMKLRGSYPDGAGEFSLTRLDYLGGNTHGWNEYRLDIFGPAKLVLSGDAATFSVTGEIEKGQIEYGRIRRYDTRITGTEALSGLRNRYERITALAEWMNTSPPPDLDLKGFEKYWKPILFPEIVPKKKSPPDWRRENDIWARSEDINWNTSYTERVFPELLRNIRNSGTLLRDWEEALDWLYIEYEWERICELLSQETVLAKKVKGKK